MREHELKTVCAYYYKRRKWCVNFEIGLLRRGALRADVLALNMRHQLVIVEVKSSVRDFKTDSKWQGYLEYADKFYFLMDESVLAKVQHLIEDRRVGLMVPYGKSVRVVKPAKTLDTLTDERRLNLITRLAFRNADVNRYKRGT